MAEPLKASLDLSEGDRVCCVPPSDGFIRGNRLADAPRAQCMEVSSGSWLAARQGRGRGPGLANLRGWGIAPATGRDDVNSLGWITP